MLHRVPSRRAGFTLIELMIVVALVAILAALAIPGYQRYRYRVRAGEAPTLLAAIRQRQTAYFNTYGRYCGDLTPNPTSYGDVSTAVTWDPTNAGWAMLGFSPDSPVHFQYAVDVGSPADTAPVPGIGDSGHGWFIATARGDLDGDGAVVVFETYNDWNRVFIGDASGQPLGQGWE